MAVGSTFTLAWADQSALDRLYRAINELGGEKAIRKVGNRAVNRTGDMARTKVTRALTAQTGLKRKVIVKALKVKRSDWATLTYTITSRGGDIALKYFGARETRAGVSAAPFSQRRVFAHTFMRGGLFPNRKALSMGGQVFMPDTSNPKWGRAFDKVKSGVVIPAEMVKGASKDAFETTMAEVLPARIEHEIRRATEGVLS
jgi:hypothetical protein